MLCCELVHSYKLPSNEHDCAYLRLDFVFWTGAPLMDKLPLNKNVCILKITFCVDWKFVPSFTSFTHLLCCELVHSQPVSCLWMNMFVHTHVVLSESSSLYLLYYSRLHFCVTDWNSFLLPPLPTCCVVKWCTLSL